MKKYEIIQIEQKEVTVDLSLLTKKDSLYFNATEIAKQFGKEVKNYLRLEQTKNYIELVKGDLKSPLEIVNIKKGKYGGTWLYNDLAIDFSRWCSPIFAYRLDKWIINRINEERNRKLEVEKLKTGYLPLTNAIQQAHDPAMFYHYSNEADLINKIVTGISSKQYEIKYGCKPREGVTIGEAEIMEKLQRANTTFIEMGNDYEKRKELLKKLYNKYVNEIY